MRHLFQHLHVASTTSSVIEDYQSLFYNASVHIGFSSHGFSSMSSGTMRGTALVDLSSTTISACTANNRSGVLCIASFELSQLNCIRKLLLTQSSRVTNKGYIGVWRKGHITFSTVMEVACEFEHPQRSTTRYALRTP